MYITIDPYYSIDFYNECKTALENNGVEYSELISIKTPYNWYFDLNQYPIMVNYETVEDNQSRFLVTKVKPLQPVDVYRLTRFENREGPSKLHQFIENEPLREVREGGYGIFFNAISKDEILKITKELPGLKIYFFGRYFNSRYKVCLCTNSIIKNYLTMDNILVETETSLDPGRFESQLNYLIFKNKEKLIKYTETPYYENGQYVPVKYKGPRSSKDLMI